MESSTKLEEKLEGAKNFLAWNYIIMLVQEENDLESFIKSCPKDKGR